MGEATLGVIVGNRGGFPGHLCETGRQAVLAALEAEGIRALIPPAEATPYGAVESYADAKKYAAFFKQHRDEIDGVLVTLPNFGDERAVADTLRMAGLSVPVLVHAFPDEVSKMGVHLRRDAFCGKISVCNNLRQYGIPFSLTRMHTVAPDDPGFREDLRRFVAVARVAKGLRGARFGAIGARPAAFNTVRFSEKLLEAAGISVITVDLSDILGRASRLPPEEPSVIRKRESLLRYLPGPGVPASSLDRMARLGVVIDRWVEENGLAGTALQCWTAIEEFYGVAPCTLMSLMSDALLPSACETDVAGAVGMYALRLASGRPAAIVDWNNNYGDDPDGAVIFHCSNLPASMLEDAAIGQHAILARQFGAENAQGAVAGRLKPGPFTFLRVSTDDRSGTIRGYVGEGELAADSLSTWGGYGVVRVPAFQRLLNHICLNGFEHHVSITRGQVASVVEEALGRYLGWSIHRQSG